MSGQAPTVACKTCAHLRLAHIDKLIVAGRSLRSISAEVGAPYDSLRRHVANGHVAGMPTGASSSPSTAPVVASDATALDMMRTIVGNLAAVDVSRLSPMAASRHFDAYRRAVESLAKMEPPPVDEFVRVEDVEGLGEFLAGLMAIADRHPQAREDIAELVRSMRTKEAS
jgi:hypothetical protein